MSDQLLPLAGRVEILRGRVAALRSGKGEYDHEGRAQALRDALATLWEAEREARNA